MPRQTKYERDNWGDKLEVIESWARQGLTDEEIAQKMGIGTRTLYEYKEKYPQFSQALKEGKREADAKVEKALYKNATGYRYREEVLTNKGDIREVERYAKPKTGAQKMWLKNRQPDKWKDKKEISGELEINPVKAILKAEEEIEDE